MTPIPLERLPDCYKSDRMFKVWESSRYMAQLSTAPRFKEAPCLVLSISRITLAGSGRWEDGMSWEELMEVKRQCGFGDCYAIEIYPRDCNIVNVENMRHIWIPADPLPFEF